MYVKYDIKNSSCWYALHELLVLSRSWPLYSVGNCIRNTSIVSGVRNYLKSVHPKLSIEHKLAPS